MIGPVLQLLEEQPLQSISGAMIAERAKVGYATFFRHYADVRDLVVDRLLPPQTNSRNR